MGAKFSLDTHGIFNKELYDSYVAGEKASEIADLTGKVIAITGTTSGSLGYFVAKTAVAKNAKYVLLLNRQSERIITTEEDIKANAKDGTTVKTVTIDLLDLESVKKAADEINKIAEKNGGLDVLCNNAGIMAMRDVRTKDGFDCQIQANQLSHVLLTKLCMPSLEKAATSRCEARVVFHSSSARMGNDLEEKYFVKGDEGSLGGDEGSMFSSMFGVEGPWMRYHQTKLANSAFAMALHDHLKANNSKVKALACDPGWAHSKLQTTAMEKGTMSSASAKLGHYLGQSAADGSLPCSLCCFSPNAVSGDFYLPSGGMKGEPVKSITDGSPLKKGGEKGTCLPENKQLVWDVCQKVLDIKF